MASRYDPMVPVMEPEGDDTDVAGIPFPAQRCATPLDFPPVLDGDSFLGEVLAFIRSTAERTAGGAPASRA
ncbi:hypothetical protein SAMN05421829_10230 [Aromatoleum tolulyticum]|uniref:Uncharacterized protein n=1 Tax=Aromatoleum tolulyticum TaxID=34027 RepID=A0A1N6PGE7_9RHOO|nr:hypothetical protein [Aromatoleum tolulyticum]SIQ03339.1 hypothetical protein SAMN05421829_10230 [Aromatoleum tolulyticum]